MLGLVGKGVIIGILVSAPMGPSGILCIQRTLSKSRWHGFVSGLGATLSDMIYAVITCLFMGLIVNFVETHLYWLQLWGSIVLGIFGLYIFRSNPVKSLRKKREAKMSFAHDFVTAFLLTFSNILIVLLYIALFARLSFILPDHSVWQILDGLCGIALGAALWWFVLTSLVAKMRRWFNIRSIRVLNRISGGIIIALALIGIFQSCFPVQGAQLTRKTVDTGIKYLHISNIPSNFDRFFEKTSTDMRVPENYYDEIFEFNGQWGVASRCGLKLSDTDGLLTVVVTELYQDNPGTSITYAGYSLACQICERKGLQLNRIRYIECNPDTHSKLSFYDEACFEVTFPEAEGASGRPQYRQLSGEEVKALFT
jgi:threonine/homoserine/homoserine lactone efflux protein